MSWTVLILVLVMAIAVTKQRVRMLAAGSFCLAIAIYFFGIWLLAGIDPNAKSHSPDFLTFFMILILWGGIFFTLRPLIAESSQQNSN
jgi:hypothetical protein